jgi:hypothetical protein
MSVHGWRILGKIFCHCISDHVKFAFFFSLSFCFLEHAPLSRALGDNLAYSIGPDSLVHTLKPLTVLLLKDSKCNGR